MFGQSCPWAHFIDPDPTQLIPNPTPIHRRCSDAPKCKFSQSRTIASQRKVTYIYRPSYVYTTSVFRKSAISDPLTQPNPCERAKAFRPCMVTACLVQRLIDLSVSPSNARLLLSVENNSGCANRPQTDNTICPSLRYY